MTTVLKNEGGVFRIPEATYDTNIPEVSFPEFMCDAMSRFGDRVAIIDAETKKSFTFSEIISTTKHLAVGLAAKFRLQRGENVAVCLPASCMEYPIAILAINLCGASATLINPSLTTKELKHCIDLTHPQYVFGTELFFNSKYTELYSDAGTRPPFIFFTNSIEDGKTTWGGLVALGSGSTVKVNHPIINPKEDVGLILFSSGTTGLPKATMMTQYNYVAARRMVIESYKLNHYPTTDEDITVSFLPLFHTAPLNGLFDNLTLGMRYILIPNFSPANLLQVIQEYKVTYIALVPAVAVFFAKQPVEKQFDLSSLQWIRLGAGTTSKEIQETLEKKFNMLHIYSGFGMTETTWMTHCNRQGGGNRKGSIGLVQPFCESKVIDPKTNQILGPNVEGELCIRGPMITKGYVGNEEATRNTIDSDGFLHTGDAAYYDTDGFVFITERIKELIKYKSYQVSPTEIEQLLLTHPGVFDVGVAAVPDDTAGELPRAYVIRRPGFTVTEAEIEKFVADQLSHYKKLRGGVVFVNSLPKTASGKVIRRELKNISSSL